MEDKLNHLPEKSRLAVIKFAKALIETFGGKLYSLILFGSAAQPPGQDVDSFKEGSSDINTAIILENVTTNELNLISNIGRRFKKAGWRSPWYSRAGISPRWIHFRWNFQT